MSLKRNALQSPQTASDSDAARDYAALIVLPGICGLALLALLSVFSVLKETALFWRNAGGYPAELREAVLIFYYPLLCANFLLCCAVSALLIAEHRAAVRCSCFSLFIAALLWALLALNAGFVIANNIENLLEGRALHYHPPM